MASKKGRAPTKPQTSTAAIAAGFEALKRQANQHHAQATAQLKSIQDQLGRTYIGMDFGSGDTTVIATIPERELLADAVALGKRIERCPDGILQAASTTKRRWYQRLARWFSF